MVGDLEVSVSSRNSGCEWFVSGGVLIRELEINERDSEDQPRDEL
jgi:hypothetical protein